MKFTFQIYMHSDSIVHRIYFDLSILTCPQRTLKLMRKSSRILKSKHIPHQKLGFTFFPYVLMDYPNENDETPWLMDYPNETSRRFSYHHPSPALSSVKAAWSLSARAWSEMSMGYFLTWKWNQDVTMLSSLHPLVTIGQMFDGCWLSEQKITSLTSKSSNTKTNSSLHTVFMFRMRLLLIFVEAKKHPADTPGLDHRPPVSAPVR